MSGHTPGPWRIGRNNPLIILAPDGKNPPWHVAKAFTECQNDETSEANARLIAAAPETAAELERLKAVNERDRSKVADCIQAVRDAIRRREWLRLGRGSYEYDDDRWRDEFTQAIEEIAHALEPLRAVAADWSDCPTTPEEIAAAREASNHLE